MTKPRRPETGDRGRGLRCRGGLDGVGVPQAAQGAAFDVAERGDAATHDLRGAVARVAIELCRATSYAPRGLETVDGCR